VSASKSNQSVVPKQTLFPASGGAGFFLVVVPDGVAWSASGNESWVQNISPASGTGEMLVTYSVQNNIGPARAGSVSVQGASLKIQQADGSWIQNENEQLLKAPMVMEFGIAVKALAKEIKKAPPETWPVLLAAGIGLIEAGEGMAMALVKSFPTVPHPGTMTEDLIVHQGTMLQEYLTEQVLE